MPIFAYASFPNSRNRFRTATVNANTKQIDIDFIGQPLTLVQPSNPNRTYILLTNLSEDVTMGYLYALTLNIDPSVTPTNGVPDQLIYNSTSNTLYEKQDNGTTNNWTVVQPKDVCEVVQPLQTAGLEALGDIYALALSNSAGIRMAYDQGRG